MRQAMWPSDTALLFCVVLSSIGLIACGSPACVLFKTYNAGFMANIHNIIHIVAYTGHPSDRVYVDDSASCGHAITEAIDAVEFADQTVALLRENLARRQDLAQRALGISPDELSGREDEPNVIELYQKLAKATREVWVFSPFMQRIIDYETEYVRVMRGHRLVIGIQARGGDKLQEQHHYATQLADRGANIAFESVRRDYAQRLEASICILVGDDMDVAGRLSKEATEAFGCLIVSRVLPMPSRKAHEEQAFNHSPLQQRCYATQRVLADVEVLANADVFVGVANSNVASMVAIVRRFVYKKDKASEYEFSGLKLKPF